MGIDTAAFMEAEKINKNFHLSIRNLKNIDYISHKGINAFLNSKKENLGII